MKSRFYTAQEVAEMLGVHQSTAYKIICITKDTLTSQGLPSTLADLIDYSDKESSEKSLENVISIFREATAQGIKNALRGHAPRVGARLPGKDPIADAFAKKAR